MKLNKITIALAAAFSLTASFTITAHAADAPADTPVANAAAATKVTDIQHMQQGGKTIIRIGLDAPLANVPKSFSVGTPPRVAFDLPGDLVVNTSNVQSFDSGFAKNLSMVQDGKKTRVVLNLREQASSELSLDGKAVLITLSRPVANVAAVAGEATRRFAEGDMTAQHSIAAFDFRRGPTGEGRVIVDLSDTKTGIDIRQQGKSLVVDFMNTSAAANLLNRMNVTDFGTLVQDVSLTTKGGATRMVINPTGDWEYNAYQADKRFVVEVRARGVKSDDAKTADGKAPGAYAGEKMSLNFQNVDVRNLLNVIADFTKLNIVAAENVKGNLTVRLQDVPWDQALDIVLTTRGLDMRRNGSVIWVAPREEIAAQEKATLEAKTQIADLETTRTESFRLNYSKAAEVAVLLNNKQQPLLSKRGSVVIDARTNQLFVQDIPSRLEEVQRIIKKVDIPVRQVQIEARIVEASDSFSRNLGARLGFSSSGVHSLGNGAKIGLGQFGYSSTSGAGTTTATFTPQVNLPANGTSSGASPSNFALTLLNNAGTSFLAMEISAAEADGRGKIVSSPRVVTGNQEKALIEQGTELPYQQASASGATSVAFKKANLKLEVTPQITPDGNVIMEVDINKDAPGANTSAGFAIDTKHIQTKVLIENGGTVVIGGIYTQDERNDVDKVPFLGDLPALGNLFRSTVKRDNKTELLIFLTPRILDDALTAAK